MASTIIVPIDPPDSEFRIWLLAHIYTGQDGTGTRVPNVGDLVVDRLMGWFFVTAINEDRTCEMEMWSDPTTESGDIELGLLGLSGGAQSEMFRCYINYDVVPARLAVDTSLVTHDSTVVNYAIFHGTDISDEDTIISAWYNQSGEFVSNKIPVALVSTDEFNNISVKAPVVGFCTKDVQDGDRVTFVAYSGAGGAVKISSLVVMKTNYIADFSSAPKQVGSIGLLCDYLSSTDDRTLEVPNNVNLHGIMMRGQVTFKDGSQNTIAIDGNKFEIIGLDNFNIMIPGETRTLVLKYYLGENESANDLTLSPDGASVQQPYTIKAIQADGAYNCKLFTFPRWVNEAEGYTLEHYLYMIDRGAYYYVTPYVQLGANSNPFYPTNYTTEQTLTFTVNLRSVNGRFSDYNHVQTEKIWLKSRGDLYGTNWLVKFSPDQPTAYGQGLVASAEYADVNNYHIKIDSGISYMDLWVEALLRYGQPVLNDQVETLDDLLPTHFKLVIGATEATYPIAYWNTTFITGEQLQDGSLVYIHFEKRLANGVTLQLSVAGLPLHYLVS